MGSGLGRHDRSPVSKPVARDATTLTYTDTGSVCETLRGLLTLGEKPTVEQRLDWLPDRWLLRMRASPPSGEGFFFRLPWRISGDEPPALADFHLDLDLHWRRTEGAAVIPRP